MYRRVWSTYKYMGYGTTCDEGSWPPASGCRHCKSSREAEGIRANPARLARKPVTKPNPTSTVPELAGRLEPEISRRHPTRQFVLLILSTASRKRKLIPGPGDFPFFYPLCVAVQQNSRTRWRTPTALCWTSHGISTVAHGRECVVLLLERYMVKHHEVARIRKWPRNSNASGPKSLDAAMTILEDIEGFAKRGFSCLYVSWFIHYTVKYHLRCKEIVNVQSGWVFQIWLLS